MQKGLLSVLVFFISFLAKSQAPHCDATLWNHVYHSYRLQIDSGCMNVTGHVYNQTQEADGDIHIRISVDTPFLYMLNSANYSGEYGKLVVEPVCVVTVTQSDAVSSCVGFTNTVYIPNDGEYVVVTGPYITDNDHGWNELHPVTSIRLVSSLSVNNALDDVYFKSMKVYPIPGDDVVSFEFTEAPHAPIYILISDVLGRSGGQYELAETKKLNVNCQYFPEGIYYYTIKQGDNTVRTGQFNVLHKK
jgi:hypothetical protein